MLFRVFCFTLFSILHDLSTLQTKNERYKALEKLTTKSLMYCGDFQVCMQNMAYGQVFNSDVLPRVPENERDIVITNCPEKLAKLHVYLEREFSRRKFEHDAKKVRSS